MKKQKFIKHKFTDPIYFFTNYILIGDHKDINNFLEKKYEITIKKNDFRDGEYFYIDHKGCRINFIYMHSFDWSIDSQACLAHEIFHLVANNMEFVGMTLSEKNDEVYAYYYGYIFNNVWNLLKPKK